MYLIPIESFSDALKVRTVRNECAAFMTRDTKQINAKQQFDWYWNTYRKENKKGDLHVFMLKDKDKVIGYGLIKKDWYSRQVLISGGLKSAERGRGAGKALFKYLIAFARILYPNNELALEVLQTNEKAHALYQKLGFKDAHFSKGVIFMTYEEPN